MATAQDFLDLKRDVEKAQREADRAQGAYESLMVRLKDEFDCASLKDAIKKLEELRTTEKTYKAEYDMLMEKFMAKWKDKLK